MKNTGEPSEIRFQEIMQKGCKSAYVFRLPDTKEVRGRVGKGWVRAQPSDYIVTEKGLTYYAEVKSTWDPKRFKKSLITTDQRKAAKLQVRAKGKYYFFVHRLAANRWYKIPAEFILLGTNSSFLWEDLEMFIWDYTK